MRADIERYGIVIRPEDNIVGDEQGVTKLKGYTTSRECKRVIRQYIKQAKDREEEERLKHQSSLF
jgi:regulator of RNase E activity RraA